MRAFASRLIRRLTHPARLLRTHSSSPAAEFPPATQSFRSTLRGSLAADRASFDALRHNTNSVITEHSYANSNIRETAAFARRPLPTRWRQSPAPPGTHPTYTSEKADCLAKDRRLLHRQRKPDRTRARAAASNEWVAFQQTRTKPRADLAQA